MAGKKASRSDIQLVKAGHLTFAHSSVGSYIFEVSGEYRMASPSVLPFYTRSRALVPVRIGDFEIVPNGEQNNYPDELRQVLDENNLTPEILLKQAQLLWGQGPALYRIKWEEGKRVKYWEENQQIQDWLDSWDYQDYLLKADIEFRHTNGHFTKFYRNLGARIGRQAKIAKLEHMSGIFSRLEWPDESNRIHHIIVGDFSQPWKYGLRAFPVFDPDDVFAYPVSMRYSNLYSFALDYQYSRAPFHGSLNWIKLASSIPKLLTNFNVNSAAIKFHIKVPSIYWEQKKQALMEKCAMQNIEYKEEMLEKMKDDTFKKFTETLTTVDNVGKFVTTDKLFDDAAQEYVGWEIEVIDQKVSDYIDAQLAIAKEAGFQNTSGIGLHPALSNLSKDGNLPSGSEQLYAFKLYLATGIDIPESIVTKDINLAIRANFPGTPYRVGFYHDVVLTEERTNPDQRVKNAV